jgi:hypothetical protein
MARSVWKCFAGVAIVGVTVFRWTAILTRREELPPTAAFGAVARPLRFPRRRRFRDFIVVGQLAFSRLVQIFCVHFIAGSRRFNRSRASLTHVQELSLVKLLTFKAHVFPALDADSRCPALFLSCLSQMKIKDLPQLL